MMYPPPIQNLIDRLAKLPTIGPKTAERLVFYLIKSEPQYLNGLVGGIIELKNSIKPCRVCHSFGLSDPCEICADGRRNPRLLCVVAKPQDIAIIEKTKAYAGKYFIIGANFSPFESATEDHGIINELTERIKREGTSEIILALNPDMGGETVVLYLTKVLKQFAGLKLTRPARGLPIGADLEYADELTLESAINNRQSLN